MVPICSSAMLELVLAVHSYHVIAYPDVTSERLWRLIFHLIDQAHCSRESHVVCMQLQRRRLYSSRGKLNTGSWISIKGLACKMQILAFGILSEPANPNFILTDICFVFLFASAILVLESFFFFFFFFSFYISARKYALFIRWWYYLRRWSLTCPFLYLIQTGDKIVSISCNSQFTT